MRIFAALADPTRVRILDALSERAYTAGEIVGLYDISQPSVSRHLRVLREAGLVSATTRGRQRVYRLEPATLREIDSWLDRYRRFWS